MVASSLLLIVVSMAASPMADLAASSAAMACCAKTNYRCAGMNGPDDCCRQMGHTTHGVAAGTLSNARPFAVAVAVLPALGESRLWSTFARRVPVSSFARPHDPPHLHSYSLLI